MDRCEVKTNKEGLFEIKVTGDGKIIIKLLGREGYDEKGISLVDYEFDKNGAYHKRLDPDERFKQADPKNPEIFRLRKKGESTLLITSDDKISFAEGEQKSYAICLVPRVSYYHKDLLEKATAAKKRIDLIIDGDYKEGLFKMKIKALGDKTAGIIVGSEKLYEAPDNEYESEREIMIPKGSESARQLWLYSRTGSPVVYSRVELKVMMQEKFAVIEYIAFVNPYGERSIEEGDYIGWLGTKYDAIESVANKALKEGKYPPKPDFKALEEEGKKEYLKTHKDAQ